LKEYFQSMVRPLRIGKSYLINYYLQNNKNPQKLSAKFLRTKNFFLRTKRNFLFQNSKKASLTSIISEGQTSLSIPPSPAIVEIDSASAAALEKDGDDEEVEDIFHYTKSIVFKKFEKIFEF